MKISYRRFCSTKAIFNAGFVVNMKYIPIANKLANIEKKKLTQFNNPQ